MADLEMRNTAQTQEST